MALVQVVSRVANINMPSSKKNDVMNNLSTQNVKEPLFAERIEFVRATSAATSHNTSGDSSSQSNNNNENAMFGTPFSNSREQMMVEVDQFPRVAVSDWLYKADDVRRLCARLRWSEARRPGAGLNNLGNTCFLNAVLQCLTYTASLAEVALDNNEDGQNENNWLEKKDGNNQRNERNQRRGRNEKNERNQRNGGRHGKHHGKQGKHGKHGKRNRNKPRDQTDMRIAVMQHIQDQLLCTNTRRAVSPKVVVKTIHNSWSSFRLGRQEDAHECLRTIVEGMHQSNLIQGGMSSDDIGPLTETTMMHRVFGGHLRSQLKCTKCGFESNTFESCMDLSVEISKRTKHIETALSEYTSIETLDRDNKWFCEKCHKKVKAKKQMTIRSPPLNLGKYSKATL